MLILVGSFYTVWQLNVHVLDELSACLFWVEMVKISMEQKWLIR